MQNSSDLGHFKLKMTQKYKQKNLKIKKGGDRGPGSLRTALLYCVHVGNMVPLNTHLFT